MVPIYTMRDDFGGSHLDLFPPEGFPFITLALFDDMTDDESGVMEDDDGGYTLIFTEDEGLPRTPQEIVAWVRTIVPNATVDFVVPIFIGS